MKLAEPTYLKVRENGAGTYPEVSCEVHNPSIDGVYVDGLSEHIIKSPSEISELLRQGSVARETASTNMNRTSSRSHAVFTIIVEHSVLVEGSKCEAHVSSISADAFQGDSATVTIGRLNLVDLAGSERVKTTGVTSGKRMEELKKINSSLSAFGWFLSYIELKLITSICRQSNSCTDIAWVAARAIQRLQADPHPPGLTWRQLQDNNDLHYLTFLKGKHCT